MTHLSYSDPRIPKPVFVAECRAHREADRLIAGTYHKGSGETFQGCAVGCAIETIRQRTKIRPDYEDHETYANLILGGCVDIARLEDTIFEGLPEPDRYFWPERFAEAIPENADLSGVADKFLARMLREVVAPIIPDQFSEVAAIVERVARGCESHWSEDDRKAARVAARPAGTAAWAASDAGTAAWAARDAGAAAWAASDAGTAARPAGTVAGEAARIVAYKAMATILCDCLAAAPVVEPAP